MKNAKQILQAINTATQTTFGKSFVWFSDEATNELVNEGVKLGWAKRHSVTQVEWTEAGVEVYKTEKNKEFFSAAIALVAFELAKDQIEYEVRYKTDEAYGLDCGEVLVMLYDKKEMWYEIEGEGLTAITNAETYGLFCQRFTAWLETKRAQL